MRCPRRAADATPPGKTLATNQLGVSILRPLKSLQTHQFPLRVYLIETHHLLRRYSTSYEPAAEC